MSQDAMSWGDLNWLSELGYEKVPDPADTRPETWILRGRAAGRLGPDYREIVIAWTSEREAQEFVEISAGMLDNDLHFVSAAIDKIDYKDLRITLDSYERRVLRMLQSGLSSARPTKQE